MGKCIDNTKFIDLDELTPHQIMNERVMLKKKIREFDLTKNNNIKYFDRICDINHRLKLIELGININKWGY